MDVPARTRLQLRVMLRHAPGAAREALAPRFSADPVSGPVTFHLSEILIIGRRPS